ncbi:18096_t:CDS:2, partial [Racocetra fulgida]
SYDVFPQRNTANLSEDNFSTSTLNEENASAETLSEDNASDTSNEVNANLGEGHIYTSSRNNIFLSRSAVTLSGNNTSTTLSRFSATNLRVSNI